MELEGTGTGSETNTEGAPVAESVLLYQTLLSHWILAVSADSPHFPQRVAQDWRQQERIIASKCTTG